MLEAAERALRFAQGTSRQTISSDELRLFAIIKSIEVIGEASTKVSEETQARLTSIEWRGIRTMRNRLIHGYDTVNFNILWDTIELALPPLIADLERALATWPGA